MQKASYVTGNELISLPRIDPQNAAIADFTFLHMGSKGLLDVRGTEAEPLIAPQFLQNGTACPLHIKEWQWENGWIPSFTGTAGTLAVRGTILTPVAQRGFAVHLEIQNISQWACCAQYGLSGAWGSTWHCVNEDKPVEGTVHCYRSGWNQSLIFDMRCGTPLFAFAPMADKTCDSRFSQQDEHVHYALLRQEMLTSTQKAELTIFWGLGFEEVAAATSAKEMLRQTFPAELERTRSWLRARSADFGDRALSEFYNRNLFFCMFYSAGLTMDTEELVLVTSRSPRYYVSAAYWDRDSLLWSFPAILDADPVFARRILAYVFGRQRRNLGVHSRFIDGTVLEPGFELDELMAPLLALERYWDKTKDVSILADGNILAGIEEILEKLRCQKAPEAQLYETFLQPTDDERKYPYLTYDNVLVWKALHAVARIFPGHAALAQQAEAVREDVLRCCVQKDADGRGYFAWSTDLNGHSDVYDEPPGSLQLLPWLGFCESSDPVYENTVRMIRSAEYPYSFSGRPFGEIGCPHAAHPWLLSVANSLLCGRLEHSLEILRRAPMDAGIVCESIDEETGVCTTGEAFATCAGFVCHALRRAWEGGMNLAE